MKLGLGLGFAHGINLQVSGGVPGNPGEPPVIPPGDIIDDGGFQEPPIVITASDNIQFKGKKASGASGKFIYNIGVAEAGTTYTMRYDPNWSGLANQGLTAMVGFGLKAGNDFHLGGLKGDGAGGLLAYEIYGTNKWNQGSGFTTINGGATVNGTKDGPNWVRFAVSLDGATYSIETSDDGENWDTEIADASPLPFSSLGAAPVFGIAVFLEAADAGHFIIDIELWQESDTPEIEPWPDPDAFTFVGALVNNSTDPTTDFTGGDTVVPWDAEVRDTNTIHDTSSNTTRLTIPVALNGAACVIHASMYSNHTSVSGIKMQLSIRKNGSASFDGAGATTVVTSFNTQTLATCETAPLIVSTGDIFELYCNKSGATSTSFQDYSTLGIYVIEPTP